MTAPAGSIPRAVPAGSGVPLTSREAEIARLVADGLSNQEIADRLVISRRTVDSHTEHIRHKTGLRDRVQVAGWVHAGGLLLAVPDMPEAQARGDVQDRLNRVRRQLAAAEQQLAIIARAHETAARAYAEFEQIITAGEAAEENHA